MFILAAYQDEWRVAVGAKHFFTHFFVARKSQFDIANGATHLEIRIIDFFRHAQSFGAKLRALEFALHTHAGILENMTQFAPR